MERGFFIKRLAVFGCFDGHKSIAEKKFGAARTELESSLSVVVAVLGILISCVFNSSARHPLTQFSARCKTMFNWLDSGIRKVGGERNRLWGKVKKGLKHNICRQFCIR